MKMKGNLISLISVIFVLFLGMAMTGCATLPPFQSAVARGDIEGVRHYLADGADINQKEDLPLILAVAFNKSDMVKFLIDKGANPNGEAADGDTPLFQAVYLQRMNMVQMLVNAGADPNKYSGYGSSSPYSWAQKKGYSEILQIFNEAEKKKLVAKEGREKVPSAKTSVEVVNPVLESTGIQIKSDVDELPLLKLKPNKNAYAIVIGIEQYRQKLPKADYAVNDAKTMTEYLTKVMGYPEENVVTLMNDRASLTDFIKYFEKWLPNNVEKDSSVFIYYSGHGAPNTKTGDAYLVPYDGDPSFIEQTGYPLKKLYESLNKLQAKEIIVALDSCFSGAGGKSVIAKGARPLVMNLEQDMKAFDKLTVLSAASGEQTSSTYDEKGHGLFTYFMLKGIKGEGDINDDGKIEIGELFDYIKPQVERIARKQYNNEQTPQLIGGKNR